MKFNEKLNEYIEILDCTAKELSQARVYQRLQ